MEEFRLKRDAPEFFCSIVDNLSWFSLGLTKGGAETYLTMILIALFVLSIFSGATNLTFVVGKYTIVI